MHQGIKRLERQGFLRIVPRHGVFVANYPETGNLDTLVALLKRNGNKLDRKTVVSVLQFREANEGMAVRMLAANHTTGHILRLRMYIDDIKKAAAKNPAATPAELAELLFSYHLYIGLQSGNNVIPMVMNAFHDVSAVFWRTWVANMGVDKAVDFLERFTARIAAGDGDGAMELYRKSAEEYLANY